MNGKNKVVSKKFIYLGSLIGFVLLLFFTNCNRIQSNADLTQSQNDLSGPDELNPPDLIPEEPPINEPQHSAISACEKLAKNKTENFTKPAFKDSNSDGQLDYLDTINSPLKDGLPMYVPYDEFPEQQYLSCGLLDVTRPPFNADSSGELDSSAQLQAAIDSANLFHLILYFPKGIYKVSKTLECIQNRYLRSSLTLPSLAGGQGGCYFMGENFGEAEQPTIFLPDATAGFTNAAEPKAILKIWARAKELSVSENEPQSNISMRNFVLGLNFKVGPGNFGALAISHPSAQGSFIEDVKIDLGPDGHTGLYGIPGSGGGVANVTIEGGHYGIRTGFQIFGYKNNSAVGVVLTGIKLIGQKKSAVVHASLESLTVVGAQIELAASSIGPVIHTPVKINESSVPNTTAVNVIDSHISFINDNTDHVVVESKSAVYFQNVWLKNANKIVRQTNSSGTSDIFTLNVDSSWQNIKELAFGPGFRQKLSDDIFYDFKQPIYRVGHSIESDRFIELGITATSPDHSLLTKHLWTTNFKNLFSPDGVNVRSAPYNAKGDGLSDDWEALQRAVDENEIVFLPKGYYRITKPLTLKSKTKLFGLGAISTIVNDPESDEFKDALMANPMIQTTRSNFTENTELSFFQILVSSRSKGAYALNWRSSEHSIFRNVIVKYRNDLGYKSSSVTFDFDKPLVLVEQNGAGKWYNFFIEDTFDAPVSTYRQLKIVDTLGPLSFYMLNNEGGQGETMTEIRRSENIDIFQLKSEGDYPILTIYDSKNISLFGRSGHHTSIPFNKTYPVDFFQTTPSSFKVFDSTSIKLTGLIDRLSIGCDDSGQPVEHCGSHQTEWIMLIVNKSGSETIRTKPLEKPIFVLAE